MQKCRMCGNTTFKKVIDFGKVPLVNSLIDKKDLDKEEPVYPLVVKQCKECFLVQIVNPISSEKIYRDQDYLYYSSDMPVLDEYFGQYASDIVQRFIKQDNEFIVEIGSNDGILLNLFKNNHNVLGIDPASNVVLRALKRGIPTMSEFFTARLARNIVNEFGKARVIMGNNCIAHLDDLNDLMEGVKILLDTDGVFVVECNYWGGMVKNKNYSLIYHDHFSYFTLQNWMNFLKKFDMEVCDALVTPAQGGSLRLFICHKGQHTSTQRLNELWKEEEKTELNSLKTTTRYKQEVEMEALKLNKIINKIKGEGNVIAGYGAAAKGFSILQLAKIGNREISYFVDDSPAKQNKYTPVTHIPVFKRHDGLPDPNYFFITAPNYEKVIVEKEQEFLKNGGHFLTVDGRII